MTQFFQPTFASDIAAYDSGAIWGDIPATTAHEPVFNFSTRKVGGLRFVKLGRLTFSFCVSRSYRPLD